MDTIRVKMSTLFIVAVVLLFCAPKAYSAYIDPNTYEDIVNFNSNALQSSQANWSHSIPAAFSPVSATITLDIEVTQYSDAGQLDLFCSNTNFFYVGSPYSASSQPGYIARLYSDVNPTFAGGDWTTVTYNLKETQLPWLQDDGNIFLGLTGPPYSYYGFPANFYLKSATLTASAVPIPGAIWLLCSGILGIVGVRRTFRKA